MRLRYVCNQKYDSDIFKTLHIDLIILLIDLLWCLVVIVPGYRRRVPCFNFRRCQIFWEVVGMERGPLSLVGITEEQLKEKVAIPV
jgi:hypothetical protein